MEDEEIRKLILKLKPKVLFGKCSYDILLPETELLIIGRDEPEPRRYIPDPRD